MDTGSTINVVLPYSPEWWQMRLGCFTASEIYRLMTEPKSKTAKEAGEISDGALTYVLEKVHEKISGVHKTGQDNYATQWGVEYEPLAAKWYAQITGNKVDEAYLCFHETIEGFSCTPDRFVNEDGLTEIKCPATGSNHLKHWLISSNEYFKREHSNYYWQAVAQMEITGREWCDFVSFDPRIDSDKGMFIYRIEKNPEDVDLLLKKVIKSREVYNQYLQLFTK